MNKAWRWPVALVTADVIALSLHMVVFFVLLATAAGANALWSNIAMYGSFAVSAGFIIAWIVIMVRRFRAETPREQFLNSPGGVALGSLGIVFGLSLLVTAAMMRYATDTITLAFTMMGFFTGSWIFIVSTVWFWRSI